MIIDGQNHLSDAQALTATALSTNVIDLGVDRSIGNGEPMAVLFTVSVAADQTTGDEDYTFAVEFASDSGITTARQEVGRRVFESGTPTAPAQNADLLVVGFSFSIPVPATTLAESEQYIAARYTLAGTSPSVTVDAALVPMSFIEANNSYADGFTIV